MITRPIATVCMFILLGCPASDPGTRIEQRLAAAEERRPRPVATRLTGIGTHAPYIAPAEPRSIVDIPKQGPQSGLRRASRESPPSTSFHRTPRLFHLSGKLDTYRLDFEDAIAKLDAAVRQEPTADRLSDLAAVQLALGRTSGDGLLLLDGLERAHRAVALAPDHREAQFNLALALSAFHLRGEATLAWDRYLAIDGASAWADEARAHRARLTTPTLETEWRDHAKRAFADAIQHRNAATVQGLVERFPRRSRIFVESELFPRWARAVTEKNERDETARLEDLRLATRTIADATGDALPWQAFEAILEVTKSKDQSNHFQRLVDGHNLYAQAQTNGANCAVAIPRYQEAHQALSGVSAFAHWATYQATRCGYHANTARAEALFRALADRIQEQPFPSLIARVDTMIGLCAAANGRRSEAIKSYERARTRFAALGDDQVGKMHDLLAETLRGLGDHAASWRHHVAALTITVPSGDPRSLYSELFGAVAHLTAMGRPTSARYFQRELLAALQTAALGPAAIGGALLRLAELNAIDALASDASQSLDEADTEIARVQDLAIRQRLEADAALVRGELTLVHAPADATESIDRALALIQASRHESKRPRATFARARARLALQDRHAAEADLALALDLYEERRAGTSTEAHRMMFFQYAQPAFDAMIRHLAIGRNEPERALAYADHAKSRVLRDHLEGTQPPSLPETIDALGETQHLPGGTVVLAYALVSDYLVIWVLRRDDELKMVTVPVERSTFESEVRRFHALLSTDGARDTTDQLGAQLHQQLIAPIQALLRPDDTLIVAPDGVLHSIPFAALRDATSERYLVEDHPIAVTPIVSRFLTAEPAPPMPASPRVLIVGNPVFDREQFPLLPGLRGAEAEARALQAIYPDADVLIGRDATRARILTALPTADIVHIAAHVEVDAFNPNHSHIVVAEDPDRPDDDRLTASDLRRTARPGARFVLVSCDTAPTHPSAVREGSMGLLGGLLGANAGDVMATLWQVSDQPTQPIGGAVLLSRPTWSCARSLMEIQRDLIDHDAATPASLAWSAFQCATRAPAP